MTKIVGISEGFHDAGHCVIQDGNILKAQHAERTTRKKNDKWLAGNSVVDIQLADTVAFYEKTWLKRTRQIRAGQRWRKTPTEYDVSFSHHKSHAAAGYYTSQFDECNILVIDAIGEWDTISIWKAWMDDDKPQMKKIKSWKYPFSLGLFYSAITQRIDFKPGEDEYITMGLSAFGEPIHEKELEPYLYSNCHKGFKSTLGFGSKIIIGAKAEDLAASGQKLVEDYVINLVKKHCSSENLVFMGGVALNCVLNSKIANLGKKMWIMPNPGDCGSSLGAAALAYGKKLNWNGPYLGTNIQRIINPKEVVSHLLKHSYCGVANGPAEFGPRALGNRSLIADPRRDLKETVNKIKRRQLFRPFAPAILGEHAKEYFEGPMNEYMQFVSSAKHDYESVTHVDGTARVQVVKEDCQSIIRPILEEWYEQTGCPMLLNTSLNIKGEPIVDTWKHAKEWSSTYNVKVF